MRHHPDRVRCVNALSDRRFTEMTGEELQNAFYDLGRMNHRETPRFSYGQYLEGGPDCGPRDRDTFHAVLRTGVSMHGRVRPGITRSNS